MKELTPAIFLDRDGVVIDDAHYLHSPDQVRLIDGSAETIAALNRAGWFVVIVTNQSGVGRGLFSIESVTRIHEYLLEVLWSSGCRVDGVYFCPHHPEAEVADYRCECECRKPKPGMLLQAAQELGIDLARSWMIGDRLSDLEAGAAAGCQTVLVRTGNGTQVKAAELDSRALKLELTAANLAEAVATLGLAKTGWKG